MKNIHILPTDKSSRLLWCFEDKRYYKSIDEFYFKNQNELQNQNIYITSDEEEPYPYALHIKKQEVLKINGIGENSKELFHDKGFNYQYECKKIILTTDQDLIKDGVQAIDDEFLEWFVKNPSWEEVGVYFDLQQLDQTNPVLKGTTSLFSTYKIIIPKEKPKQETLEEANFKVLGTKTDTFYSGAKWQQEQYTIEEQHIGHTIDKLDKEYIKGFNEGSAYYIKRMYSEEDMLKSFMAGIKCESNSGKNFEQFIEQFKNK